MHRRRDGGRAIFPLLLDALTSPQQHSSSYEGLRREERLREGSAKYRNFYCVRVGGILRRCRAIIITRASGGL